MLSGLMVLILLLQVWRRIWEQWDSWSGHVSRAGAKQLSLLFLLLKKVCPFEVRYFWNDGRVYRGEWANNRTPWSLRHDKNLFCLMNFCCSPPHVRMSGTGTFTWRDGRKCSYRFLHMCCTKKSTDWWKPWVLNSSPHLLISLPSVCFQVRGQLSAW